MYCIYYNREKVREWIQWTAARLQREWGALGGCGGALEQLAALASALPIHHHRRAALHQLRDTLLHHDVSPFEVCTIRSILSISYFSQGYFFLVYSKYCVHTIE